MNSLPKIRQLTLCSLVLLAFTLSSWNKPGHQATGAVAFLYLKEHDPSAIQNVVELLTEHPEFADRWENDFKRLQGDDKAMYLFMKAAEWPDVIKDDNPNNFPVENDGHYINWPIKFKPSVKVVQPGEERNILKQLAIKMEVVRTGQDPGDRAMALCWVFHLLGDIHQPLHNVALFGTGFPKKGDQGGNLFFIRETEDGATRKLHSFWDGAVMTSSEFSALKSKASETKTGEGIEFASGENQEFEKWSKEFVGIAETNVYKFNNKFVLSGTKDEGKVLPSGYVKNAKKISKTQVATAGMRLASILSEIF